MRALVAILLAIVLSACASPSPTGSLAASPSAAPSPTGSLAASPSAAPSVDGDPLSEFLPSSVNGVATTRADMNPASRNSPRVFLKVIARVGKKPPDAELALAFGSNTTVYAVRIDGVSGADIAQAFLIERAGSAAASATTPVSVGGKQVTRLGVNVGSFLYATGDVFYFVEGPDEATAADALRQLP